MNFSYPYFHSQFGEDEWLRKNIFTDPAQIGYFLDVGAGDPIRLSNTYHFEQNGWTGLCIDADPRTFAQLVALRKEAFFSVVGTDNGIVDFYMNKDTPDISRVTPQGNEVKIALPSLTLDHILAHFKITSVDLLSIDIEGEEIKVLHSLFEKTFIRPKVIIVEYNTSGVIREEQVKTYMKLFTGYEVVHKTEANLIYKGGE